MTTGNSRKNPLLSGGESAAQAESTPLILQNALEEMGASAIALGSDTPYDDVLAEAFYDKMAERPLAS